MNELTLKNVKPAKRYAEALFEAMEDNNFKEILSEFNNAVEIINENEDFKNFLSNPVISNDEKKRLVDECFSSFSEILKTSYLF